MNRIAFLQFILLLAMFALFCFGCDKYKSDYDESVIESSNTAVIITENSESEETVCQVYVDGVKLGTFKDLLTAQSYIEKVVDGYVKTNGALPDKVEVLNSIEYRTVIVKNLHIDELKTPKPPVLTVRIYSKYQKETDLPYETIFIDRSDKDSKTNNVLVDGKNGSICETHSCVFEKGKLVSDVIIATQVLKSPVNEVVERGVKHEFSDKPDLKIFIMPYDGGITSEYGKRHLMGKSFHYGVDVAAKVHGDSCNGDPIKAAGDGVVVFAGTGGDYGKLTIIEHPNGIQTYYAHQSKITVKVGDTVKQGDIIGKIGSTGQSQGPHIHFEVRIPNESGKYIQADPKDYIINYSSYYRK